MLLLGVLNLITSGWPETNCKFHFVTRRVVMDLGLEIKYHRRRASGIPSLGEVAETLKKRNTALIPKDVKTTLESRIKMVGVGGVYIIHNLRMAISKIGVASLIVTVGNAIMIAGSVRTGRPTAIVLV
jgi:hypothetical protein